MLFIGGVLVGLVIAVLVVATLLYFRSPIEQAAKIAQTAIQNVGPRPKGFIVEPQSEADAARQQIIEENDRKGIDTKISDLT